MPPARHGVELARARVRNLATLSNMATRQRFSLRANRFANRRRATHGGYRVFDERATPLPLTDDVALEARG